MPETINIDTEDRNGTVHWGLVSLCSALKRPQFEKVLSDNGEYEIDIKINGVPVKFSGLLNALKDQFDHHVEKSAAAMADKKVSAIANGVDVLRDIVADSCKKALDTAGDTVNRHNYDLEEVDGLLPLERGQYNVPSHQTGYSNMMTVHEFRNLCEEGDMGEGYGWAARMMSDMSVDIDAKNPCAMPKE